MQLTERQKKMLFCIEGLRSLEIKGKIEWKTMEYAKELRKLFLEEFNLELSER